MSDGPHLLISDEADLQDVVFGTRKIIPIERHGRPSLCPEFVHGQEVLDVFVKQFLKDQLGIVSGIDGPLTSRDSDDVSVVDGRVFRLFAFVAIFVAVGVAIFFRSICLKNIKDFLSMISRDSDLFNLYFYKE